MTDQFVPGKVEKELTYSQKGALERKAKLIGKSQGKWFILNPNKPNRAARRRAGKTVVKK